MPTEPQCKRSRCCAHKRSDTFSTAPVRYLGWSTEIARSLGPLVDSHLSDLAKLVRSAYVLLDVHYKAKETWRGSRDWWRTGCRAGDTLVWHLLATVALPSVIMPRIRSAGKFLLCRTPLASYAKPFGLGLSLAAIPFIYEPIDCGVDNLMDKTVRPLVHKYILEEDITNRQFWWESEDPQRTQTKTKSKK